MTKSKSQILRALGAGALAGMRSMSAPAWANHYRKHSKKAQRITQAIAVFELVADKLPSMGSRLRPPSLALRAGSGMIAAMALATSEDSENHPAWLAAAGGVGALSASFALYHLRKALTEKLQVKDFYVGLAEDVLTFKVGKEVFGGKSAVS